MMIDAMRLDVNITSRMLSNNEVLNHKEKSF